MHDYGNHATFLEGLWRAPDGTFSPSGADLTVYDSVWGFTVYRTAYRPSSEEQWQALLDDIRADVVEQMTGPDGKYQADPTAQRMISLFRLDTRSDPAVLDGLNLDDLRTVYKDEVEGRPMNADRKERKLFLLVDHEVVNAPRKNPDEIGYKSRIKCVDVEYVASNHVGRNPRAGPQIYFGWMKLATRCVPQLWSLSGLQWLDSLAPSVREGLEVEAWDEGGPFF
jgi:hypothetical protein